MKYCQGTKCHQYRTKDRIRGNKGSKYYGTRRRSDFNYGNGNFCSLNCLYDWINDHIDNALNHFGRLTEPKKIMCQNAWYKDYIYRYPDDANYCLRNDLLGKRIPLSEQQWENIDDNNISAFISSQSIKE